MFIGFRIGFVCVLDMFCRLSGLFTCLGFGLGLCVCFLSLLYLINLYLLSYAFSFGWFKSFADWAVLFTLLGVSSVICL